MDDFDKGADDPFGDKIIPFWEVGILPKFASSEIPLFPLVIRQILTPAFDTCRKQIGDNRKLELFAPKEGTYKFPFLVYAWDGYHALAGNRVGLQFTYGGAGSFGFNLTAARRDKTYRYQTSFYEKLFRIEDTDFQAKVNYLCAFGVGMAMSLERYRLHHAEWTKTPLHPPKEPPPPPKPEWDAELAWERCMNGTPEPSA